MDEEIKKIYILHQYYDKSHFKALYDCCNEYGYLIEKYVILDKITIIKRMLKRIIRDRELFSAIKDCIKDFINIFLVKNLKGEVLIVGIAPYDKLLNKYKDVFKRNNSIYFTSWQFWDGDYFPRGKKENKSEFENILENNFKGVACVSESTQYYMKRFFKFTSVVNHAINIDKYKKKDSYSRNKKYLFLGSFDERKNIPLLIEWNNKNYNLNYEFHFCGGGKLESDIINLTLKNKKVKFLGRLTKDEIQEKLREYDFLVLPSKEEPFGIVILEALSAAVPCIVSNALGPQEIIRDEYNGFIFNKDDKYEFDKIMKYSLNMKEDEYMKLSRNAIESSLRYDSSNIIKKWIELIEQTN